MPARLQIFCFGSNFGAVLIWLKTPQDPRQPGNASTCSTLSNVGFYSAGICVQPHQHTHHALSVPRLPHTHRDIASFHTRPFPAPAIMEVNNETGNEAETADSRDNCPRPVACGGQTTEKATHVISFVAGVSKKTAAMARLPS